jgi:hypothetical protein
VNWVFSVGQVSVLGLLIEVEGVLAMEIGASAGLGYGDRGSTPVLGDY